MAKPVSRNPYARSLRVKPQQVISDKRREKISRDLQDVYRLDEDIPDDWQEMLSKLK